ncbi:uncharacterized protein LOC134769883 [Penaeus indicus]|uniref:uncharacterized protein LOC134769883 n=1 Tax=Penaeus indicus TaxID=29960 RepID=UPI00300CC556
MVIGRVLPPPRRSPATRQILVPQCQRGERGPLTQGNVLPSQGTGTSALGYGPPGSVGQGCLPGHEYGHPHGSQDWSPPKKSDHVRNLPFHISSPVTTPPTSTPNPSSTPFTPIPTTESLPLPKPSPLSLPAASQLPRALADSPAFNSAEPPTCPSPGAPSQQTPANIDSLASLKSTKSPPKN